MFTEEHKINTYIKTKQQKRTDRAHHDYHTIDNHEEREKEEKKSAAQQPDRWKALRLLTNCTKCSRAHY